MTIRKICLSIGIQRLSIAFALLQRMSLTPLDNRMALTTTGKACRIRGQCGKKRQRNWRETMQHCYQALKQGKSRMRCCIQCIESSVVVVVRSDRQNCTTSVPEPSWSRIADMRPIAGCPTFWPLKKKQGTRPRAAFYSLVPANKTATHLFFLSSSSSHRNLQWLLQTLNTIPRMSVFLPWKCTSLIV